MHILMFSAGFLGGNRNGGAIHRLSVALLGPWVDFPLRAHSRVYWKHPNYCCHQHVHCLNLQCLLQKSPSAINYQKKQWTSGNMEKIIKHPHKLSKTIKQIINSSNIVKFIKQTFKKSLKTSTSSQKKHPKTAQTSPQNPEKNPPKNHSLQLRATPRPLAAIGSGRAAHGRAQRGHPEVDVPKKIWKCI